MVAVKQWDGIWLTVCHQRPRQRCRFGTSLTSIIIGESTGTEAGETTLITADCINWHSRIRSMTLEKCDH